MADVTPSRPQGLPRSVDRLVDAGLAAVVLGTGLLALAFLTNPVPDPSFPWATLPARFRLPVTQPRIEHWPVSYTVGLWLIVFAFPSLFLAGYRRIGPVTSGPARLWFTGLPVAAMLGFTTYCRFFWPKLEPATWNAPSYTLVCWAYCSSYVPAWSNAAYAVAGFGALATVLAWRDAPGATYALGAWGLAAFPLGLPAVYEAWCRRRRETGGQDRPAATGSA